MNEHPLSEDITKLSSDELDKRYSELMKRFTIARRMNMGQSVVDQLNLMLDTIENEKYRRLQDHVTESDPVVIDTDPID